MNLEKTKKSVRNIIVSKGAKSYFVSLTEIMIFFYENRNVFLITKNNEILLCDMDLSTIENEIESNFFRINRQVIINIEAIDYFCQESNNNILIHSSIILSGINLSVSKNNAFKFKQWIKYGYSQGKLIL